jgi:hypothetical protein
MKTAIILSGCLRTFMMPLRDAPGRLCDEFCHHFLKNDPDIFVVTEPDDFWLDGVHYCRELHIANADGFRFGQQVKYIDPADGMAKITDALTSHFGHYLKSITFDNTRHDDPKYTALKASGCAGVSPSMVANQYRKIKMGWEAMEAYENHQGEGMIGDGQQYRAVFRCRFDTRYVGNFPAFEQYWWEKSDVFIPGSRPKLVFDWAALGNRPAMNHLCHIYDRLTDIPPRTHFYECRTCGLATSDNYPCPKCKTQMVPNDITIASEHYVWRTIRDNCLRTSPLDVGMYVYRFRAENDPLDTALVSVGDGVRVVNHTTDGRDEERVIR